MTLIIAAAQARAQARAAEQAQRPPIDYARMSKVWPQQKAALTRALTRYEALTDGLRPWEEPTPQQHRAIKAAQEQVAKVCRDAVAVWNEVGAWPDDWSRFQRALDDVLPFGSGVRLEDL